MVLRAPSLLPPSPLSRRLSRSHARRPTARERMETRRMRKLVMSLLSCLVLGAAAFPAGCGSSSRSNGFCDPTSCAGDAGSGGSADDASIFGDAGAVVPTALSVAPATANLDVSDLLNLPKLTL